MKLTFKHSVINQGDKKEVDHYTSPHTMGIQRSQYICIEHEPSNQLKDYVMQVRDQNGQFDELNAMIEGDEAPLAIRYCKAAEVNQKR